jgi:nebulin
VFFFPQIKVAYKKDAKENLHYTTVADRPDIKKATQAAKQASEVRVSLKWPGTEGPL